MSNTPAFLTESHMFPQGSAQLAQRPTSQNNNYTLHGILKGHHGAVLCLRTTDGKLASGGEGIHPSELRSIAELTVGMDGVRVWGLPKMNPLVTPAGAGQRGATSALVWVGRKDESRDGLVYGTQNGFLVCWKQSREPEVFEELYCVQVANPGEITGLAFEAAKNHIAMCNRNSVVQLFTIDTMMRLYVIFSVTLGDYLPKAIAFGQISGGDRDRDILTFGLHDGEIHTLRGWDGKVEHTRSTGGMMYVGREVARHCYALIYPSGDAEVNVTKGIFCIDDPTQGVALYRLDSGARVRTCPVAVTKAMRPRQVSFTEDCSAMVSGSDHGVVYVFDTGSGELVDQLRMDPDDWIQTVLATDVNGISTILAAKSRDIDTENEIYVWKKIAEKRREGIPNYVLNMKIAIRICMWVATVAFICQNVFIIGNALGLWGLLLGRRQIGEK